MTSDGIDLEKLRSWLDRSVPGYSGRPALVRFEDGQSNPTFRLHSESGTYVLRRKPAGTTLPSAHAVDREFRVMQALTGTNVPVARPLALCEDPGVIGSPFYVMEYVAGRVFWDQTLPDLSRGERAAVFDSMNATIAALHGVDWRAVGLEGFGRPENYLARQIARWTKQYRAAETTPIPAMDRIIEWLPARMPARDASRDRAWRLPHGQFDFPSDGAARRCRAGLGTFDDWRSGGGFRLPCDVLAFLARAVSRPGRRGFRKRSASRPRLSMRRRISVACANRPLRTGSITSCSACSVSSPILQGIAKRALDGTAAGADAVEHGSRAPAIAEQAWELARSLG